ncbi:MAG: DNA-directed RNA polymerase subunit omega [Planctomycetes bacterium]|nr:DNA-directed RNA polymerase subunit omega [Planctomycetota bacterium]
MLKIQDSLLNAEILGKCTEEVGGIFRFTVLLQRRVRELVRGATPLVAVTTEMDPIDIALKEFLDGKISFQDVEAKKKSKSKK